MKTRNDRNKRTNDDKKEKQGRGRVRGKEFMKICVCRSVKDKVREEKED